jgi:RNA polymerase sigma-19 factor, ECF subfamily
MSDAELTADQAKQLDAMFRQDYDWLQHWLRRYTRTGHSAEDIAAETIARMAALARSTMIREPRAMMTTIARRIVYDLSARHDLQRAYEDALTHLPVALEPSAEERMIIQEALYEIDRRLKNIPEKARCAFLLYEVDGMRQAEIAAVLQVSISMVRKYIASAMRHCYAGEGYE